MPPTRQLDDAFLSSLLEKQDYPELKSNIDSESLTSILKKLNSTSDALQQELFEQVHDNFDEFSTWYNSSQELHSRVLNLVKQASDTQQQVTSTKTRVEKSIEKYHHILGESQQNKSKINLLEHIEHVLQTVEAIEAELGQFNYLDAVQHILQLSAILKEWENADPRVIQMINARVRQLNQTLVLGLQDGMRTAIKYNPRSMRILETYQPSTISNKRVHIRDVFQSFFQLGLLPEELMAVQRSIFKNIFHFYFECSHCTLQMDDVQVENEGQGGVLQVIPEAKDEGHIDPIAMLHHMETILDFIYKYTFTSTEAKPKDKEMKLLFGNLFMPDLNELMITKSIEPAIPSSKYNLGDFEHVTQAVNRFESHCRDKYGFQLDETRLGLYVKNIDRHYAKKRRNRILQEGRKVMMRRVYDTEMTSVQEDGHTYHYQITQTPQLLSVLVSDTLSEGFDLLDSHPISASTLMDGVQDLLDMYRSIMPSFHRTQYLFSPCNSLVFRNDCVWLANQLTTTIASKPGSSQFPKLKAGLEEAAVRLRQVGAAWYELTMLQRVQMLRSVLDHLDGFSGMAENAKFQQDCDGAIAQIIALVGSFAVETRPVIDETLFLDMLGRVVDSVLVRLINDIEGLLDIGAEESHIIAGTLNSLARLVGAFDLPGKDATEGFVVELVPSWQKFWLVKDILEMNMSDIMQSFRRGDLHMFEKSELIGLLCSLFADTELRESNIQEIKTGGVSSSQHYPSGVVSAAVAVQPQQTMTRERSPAATSTNTTPSIPHALAYSPDDDDDETVEASGWGDDDNDVDLFANDNSVLKPSPNLEYDDDTTTEADGGWGDADEDIFDNNDAFLIKGESAGNGHDAKKHSEETTSRSIHSKSDTNNPTPLNATATTTTSAHLLCAPALNLETEDDDAWGWNDEDDDDLFRDEI